MIHFVAIAILHTSFIILMLQTIFQKISLYRGGAEHITYLEIQLRKKYFKILFYLKTLFNLFCGPQGT